MDVVLDDTTRVASLSEAAPSRISPIRKFARTSCVFQIFLVLLCAGRNEGVPAQSAGPANVQPAPVPAALLSGHPDYIEPSAPAPVPATSGASGASEVTPSGLPAAVGRTKANFAVSQTGAAVYSIPLW